MKFKTKAQAALEFLMTYGWAILVVLVAIGALAYFGVFNSSKLITEKCIAEAPFGCAGATATTYGSMIVLSGDPVKDITITNITTDACTDADVRACIGTGCTDFDVYFSEGDTLDLKTGEKATVQCSCSDASETETLSSTIEIIYVLSGAAYDHKKTIEVSNTIIDALKPTCPSPPYDACTTLERYCDGDWKYQYVKCCDGECITDSTRNLYKY